MRFVLLNFALLLSACNSLASGVPNYQDSAGFDRVMLSLSPWEDGSPDRSNDGRTPGEQNSDRQVFRRWFQRYIENEVYAQHSKDYRPFDVPATVAEAVEDQRKFEAEKEVAHEAVQQRNLAERAAEEAERIARDQAVEAADAERRERDEAEQTGWQRQAAADAALKLQESAKENARVNAAAAEQRAESDCLYNRREAISAAMRSPTNPDAAAARVRATFRCATEAQR